LNRAIGLLAALVVAPLSAQLEFATKRIEHTAGYEETSFVAEFAFTVAGESPIEIREVRTSCGCTVANHPEGEFVPGQSGTIQAAFNDGSRTGAQFKSIHVTTNEGDHELTLEVSIPSKWDTSTKALFWRAGESRDPKPVSITFHFATPIRFVGLTAENPYFRLAEETVGLEGTRLDVSFVPVGTDSTGVHRIELEVRGKDEQEFRIPLYLRAL